MYRYDDFDAALVARRVAQFRDQTQRFLARRADRGRVPAAAPAKRPLHPEARADAAHRDSVRPRSPRRSCACWRSIARQYDRGYGHFTTRQNIQLNWPRLEDVPDILALLATVDMHAIQTSGNCVRNTTSDPFAGVAADEIVDPRPWCELIRQWSTLHPEFAFLPRKFKIAVTGATVDRTAALVHDIGAQAVRNDARRNRLPDPRRRRPGPHADARARDPRVPAGAGAPQLFRRDPARLQPARPPRQQVQGADQDPREGADAGRVHAPGRSRMGAPARRPGHRARRRDRAARRAFHRPALPRLRPRQRRLSRRDRRQPAVLALGGAQREARTSARATRSSRCRSSAPERRPAT